MADIDQVFILFTKTYLERISNLQVFIICKGCKAEYAAEIDYPLWAIDHKNDRNREPLPYELINWGFNDWKAYPKGLTANSEIQS